MWFEPISSWLVALLSTGIPWLNEKTTKSIPAEYWANKELHHKDIMDGVSAKEIVRRAEAGRYYIPKAVFEAYPVPHRNASNNKIIIENSTLYYEDVDQYGAYQAQQWVKQGKYNLNKEEMAVETLRINKKYGWSTNSDENNNGATIDNIDWHDTEAVRQCSIWTLFNRHARKVHLFRNMFVFDDILHALITLVYASRMWGINKEMPVTASSAAAQGAYLAIRDYMGLGSKEEYQLAYSGIKKVIKGKEPMQNCPGYLEVSNMEPYDHGAMLLLTAAAQSYKGGFNGCIQVGWFEGDTYYDYDLQNAYPTSMCSVYDIDFRDGINPLEFAPITERYLTLEDFNTPYDPLYAYISFEFPEGTRYPCIPISHEGSLVFPRTSAGFEGVYACGPDIYLALKMGARVYCQAGYRGRIRRRTDGSPSQSLRETVFQLVRDRNTAKKIYGKGSIEELILKIMVNSIYGKTAQNVIVKHTWDCANQEYKDLGASIVTCPAHAAIITAGVRCVLIAAMTQLEQKGYQVYSVTTDGFISNAPLDVLSSLDLFGFADVFKEARLYLTAGQSDAMWEPKHTMTRFLNLGTRANVSPDDGGVCAHGGLVTGCIPDTLEDRADYIRKVITRTGTVPSPHIEFANLKTLVMKSEDFHTYDCTTNISFDFDMKRKPMETTLCSVWVDAESGNYTTAADALPGYYEMACFDTEAFSSIAEYEKYRTIKSGCEILRTAAQWKKFFVKAKCPAGSKNRVTDTDWSILMSCIIGYRHNILKIEPLDRCETTKDKLEYINAHNNTGNVFTENHWKNARRPERKTQMLPIKAIEEALLQLREECAA